MTKKTKALIDELRKEISDKNGLIRHLTSEVDRLHNLDDKLKVIEEHFDRTPDDCTPGKWCAGCEFSRAISVPDTIYHVDCFGHCNYDRKVIHVCERAMACSEFVPKEVPKDD